MARSAASVLPLRSLDHFVIAVHDAQTSGRGYERLGFQVLPMMRHVELGCNNRVVQLHDTYLELLGDVHKSTSRLRARMLPRFACGEGLAIVSLTSSGLEQDREQVKRMRFDAGEILNARRAVMMPDGTAQETDSRCFYVWRPERPYATLFYTHHHKPQTIWIPAYQNHPNSALRVNGITYVSTDPLAEVGYVGGLLGAGPVSSQHDRVIFETGRKERIEFLSPKLLPDRFGTACAPWCAAQPAYGLALEIAVADLDQCRAALTSGPARFESLKDRVRVPADEAHGVVLDFIQSPSDGGARAA